MANKEKRQCKREEEERQQLIIQQTFYKNNQTKKEKSKIGHGKKISIQYLQHQIKFYDNWCIRNPEEFTPISYNKEKNLDAFVRHCYVKYQTPNHLFKQFRSSFASHNINMYKDYPEYDLWFLSIARGESFYKLTKDIFTKTEARCFLEYKGDVFSTRQVVWYAKFKSLGMSDQFINKILSRIIDSKNYFEYKEWESVRSFIHFVANNEKELDNKDFMELADYFNAKLRVRDFSFKGRTVSSVMALSNEWHILQIKAKAGADVRWEPMYNTIWEMTDNQHLIKAIELTNNKELLSEGKSQHHCVYSYVSRCAEGDTAIFSLRFYDKVNTHVEDKEYRITLEINKRNNNICQAKHRWNSCISDGDMRIISEFAGTKGLTYSRKYL